MRKATIQALFAIALVAGAVCAPAQSFLDVADASLDAIREGREQNAAPANVRAIFAKAKAAADADDKLNLCGFYTGMSAADARTLVGHYALKDSEWSIEGDPVYKIYLSLKGVRRVTKGGNTFDELVQAVANRIGDLRHDYQNNRYERKTIDGIVVTVSESDGLKYFDGPLKETADRLRAEAERQAQEELFASRKETVIPDLIAGMVPIPGKGYMMGKYEVTQLQWETVMGTNPARFKGLDNPVESISWNNCQLFISKLNSLPEVKSSGLVFRLPTLEEWSYAAGKCPSFPDSEAWYRSNSGNRTHPVGQKRPNSFGLYDMYGNVYERTSTRRGSGYAHEGGSYGRGTWAFGGHDAYGDSWNSWDEDGFRLCADRNAEEVNGSTHAKPKEKAFRTAPAGKGKTKIVPVSDSVAIELQSIPRNLWFGQYEVTQAQWEAVMGDNPSMFKGDDNPVESVSWDDCQEFLKKLNALSSVKKSGLVFRLPTEEEWEYACRAGTTGDYCLLADGSEITVNTLGRVAWFEGNSGGEPHPVGQKTPNAFGLYDMHGNVIEWTLTANGEDRVYRGGSRSNSSGRCKSSSRGRCLHSKRYSNLGFRLCADRKAE